MKDNQGASAKADRAGGPADLSRCASQPEALIPCADPAMAWRVATAIYREYENRPIYAQGQMNGILAGELAIAAIKAMREPTDTMLLAVCHSHDPEEATSGGKRGCSRQVAAASRWRKMIDAVVAEPAQGIEARQRHDREAGHGRNDESPVAESDAP